MNKINVNKRKIAEEYENFEFVQEVLAQIPWYHNVILMEKIKDINARKWYTYTSNFMVTKGGENV